MHTYIHKVYYYETDKMGITHHSNYVRWMEEARTDFFKSIGYGMKKLEQDSIASPVVSIQCQYKRPTTFDDEVRIDVTLDKYTGAKLEMSYVMTDVKTGTVVLTATSTHCFIDTSGRPIAVKKHLPEFDAALKALITNK